MPEYVRFLLALLLLVPGLAFGQPAEAETFGYEEGRITAIDEAGSRATVRLNDGRVINADLGQPLPNQDVGPELPDFKVGQQVETYWYQGADGRPVWAVTDWVRRPALWWLVGLFLVATVAIAGFKGLRAFAATSVGLVIRSEERRVGKECTGGSGQEQ